MVFLPAGKTVQQVRDEFVSLMQCGDCNYTETGSELLGDLDTLLGACPCPTTSNRIIPGDKVQNYIDDLGVRIGCEPCVPTVICGGCEMPETVVAEFSAWQDVTIPLGNGGTLKVNLSDLNGESITFSNPKPKGFGCRYVDNSPTLPDRGPPPAGGFYEPPPGSPISVLIERDNPPTSTSVPQDWTYQAGAFENRDPLDDEISGALWLEWNDSEQEWQFKMTLYGDFQYLASGVFPTVDSTLIEIVINDIYGNPPQPPVPFNTNKFGCDQLQGVKSAHAIINGGTINSTLYDNITGSVKFN